MCAKTRSSSCVTVACRDKTCQLALLKLIYLYKMPGPSNSSVKRKRKSRGKENNKSQGGILLVPVQPPLNQDSTTTNTAQEPPIDYESKVPSPPSYLRTPSPLHQLQKSKETSCSLDDRVSSTVEEAMFKQPFIHDPGNGPRVRIAKEFISSFFAQPPAFDVSPILVLLVETIMTHSNHRIHYALNLHKTKFYKCFARCCQRKLLW